MIVRVRWHLGRVGASLFLIGLLPAGCSSSSSTPTASAPAAAAPARSTPSPKPAKPNPAGLPADYGGLGITSDTFYAHNTHGGPDTLGYADYTIDAIDAHGRVVAYHVHAPSEPRGTGRELLILVDGINLPEDQQDTEINGGTCRVVSSATLRRLLGLRYAVLTADPGAQTAAARASNRPAC